MRRDRDRDRDRERAPRRYDDDDRASRGPSFSRETGQELATYRISVGKRHRVVPGAFVGAIANEGGLRRSDFGHISIRPDHSIVELPDDLPRDVFDALDRTRISGVLINLEPDRGAPSGRPGNAGGGGKARFRAGRKRP